MRALFTLMVFLFAVAPPSWASDTELKPSEVFAIDAPSIVILDSFDKAGKPVAQGSGVVIAKDIVVSNCHVIENANTASVLYKDQHISSQLLYKDDEHDLCAFVVKGLNAPPVRMGSTSEVKVGDAAYAIGAPEGLELTLSGGLISSLRQIPGGVVLQMTTPISPGSSGGGLFDSYARLIGITSYYLTQGEQLNFALPIEWVNELPQRGKLAKADTEKLNRVSTSNQGTHLQDGIRALHSGDYASALKIIKPLADNGNPVAQDLVGGMYELGVGVPQNYTQAVSWYRKAAELGNADAQSELGTMYFDGDGLPQDYSTGIMWLRKSAEQGYAEAQYYIGISYEYGKGVTQDFAQAVEWYYKAAKQGNAMAQYKLGLMYEVGIGVSQDYVQAMSWFRKAALQDNAGAQTSLGVLYATGEGVKQDYATALSWFRKSAKQGDSGAQYALGVSYEYGNGVTQDFAEAANWYYKAAKQDSISAQTKLGMMYFSGQGVPQDYMQAHLWLQKAAEQGDAEAEGSLGLMYDLGRGVSQDYVQAVSWYRKAAAQGYANAENNLGTLYQYGTGVPQDYIVAYALYNFAASHDSNDQDKATVNRSKVVNSMTTEQVETGQALTREMQRVGVINALDTYLNGGGQ